MVLKCSQNSRQSKTLTLIVDKLDIKPQDRRTFAIVNDVFKYVIGYAVFSLIVFGLYLSKIKIAVFDCRISIRRAKAQVSFDCMVRPKFRGYMYLRMRDQGTGFRRMKSG